jgi:ABC-type branched-subunit amino acid transport system substrate-binding protein
VTHTIDVGDFLCASPEGFNMRREIKVGLILALSLLAAGTALGGEGVQVKITNDGTKDIVVTVYDMNANPRKILLQNAHINGFTSVPISAIADATGRANLSWTATSTDATSKMCGQADSLGLGDDSAVNVHAESSCGV